VADLLLLVCGSESVFGFFFLVFLIWSVDLFSLAFCLDRKEFNGKSIIDRPAKELGDYEIENSDSE